MADGVDNLIPVERLLQKRREVAGSTESAAPHQENRRERATGGRVVSIKRMPRIDLETGRRAAEQDKRDGVVLSRRPKTRGERVGVERPCPFVSCRHHLYLDVVPGGAIRINAPGLEPDEMPADGSCSLDIADQGGETLERVGELMNFTRERTRQIEAAACAKLSDKDRRKQMLGAFVERGVTRGAVDDGSHDLIGVSESLFRALRSFAASRPKALARSVAVGANGLRIGDVVPKEKP